MAKDWIERPIGLFAAQAKIFTSALAADPAKYQINPTDVALLEAEYDDFVAKFAVSGDPTTRTSPAIFGRNDAAKRLKARMRDLGGRVRANSSISATDKLALTLKLPGAAAAALSGVPQTRPLVRIGGLSGNVLAVRLQEPDSSRAGKPAYVNGAEIFFAFGEAQPTSMEDWRPGAITLSSRAKFTIPHVPPGTRIWITARWFNTRGPGACANPVSIHLANVFGGDSQSGGLFGRAAAAA